jgi:hypothetical protein
VFFNFTNKYYNPFLPNRVALCKSMVIPPRPSLGGLLRECLVKLFTRQTLPGLARTGFLVQGGTVQNWQYFLLLASMFAMAIFIGEKIDELISVLTRIL